MTDDQKNERLRARKCPSCEGPLEERQRMFHSRRAGSMSGLVCVTCNSLWDDPDNSFLKANDSYLTVADLRSYAKR